MPLNNLSFEVANVTPNTYTLVNVVNGAAIFTTGFPAYVSGGSSEPVSYTHLMVDVRAESEAAARGETLPEPVQEVHPQAVFRADLAHDVQASGAVPVFPQPESHVDPVPAETTWKEPGSMEHPATEPHVEPPAKG